MPEDKMISSEIANVNIYPTTMLKYKWKNSKKLNEELRKMILDKEKEEKEKNIKREISNVGGFHSDVELLTWNYPCVKIFIERLKQMCACMAKAQNIKEGNNIDLSIAAWGNVSRSGDYNSIHRHPNNTWSGCYYIDDGNPKKDVRFNGYLEFLDPRGGADMLTINSIPAPRYLIDPIPGMMIIFPSYMDHFVHPYIGNKERISIAFNVRTIEPKPKTSA